jgi:hypothetical protein
MERFERTIASYRDSDFVGAWSRGEVVSKSMSGVKKPRLLDAVVSSLLRQ